MKKFSLSILLVLLICTQSMAESTVWKIQKGGSVMYLGGTFHLLRQSDFPIPPEFYEAYGKSEIIVFETDIAKLEDPSTQQALMAKAMYTDGSTIENHLSPETYRLLKDYCASNAIPLEALKQFKPSIVLVTIATMELVKFGVVQEGVDMVFYQLAIQDNKVVEGLETVEEQINFIVSMGNGIEDAFVSHSIRDLKSIKQQYEKIVKAWKKGDVKQLNDLMIVDLKTKTPKVYKELITDRNKNWLPVIDSYQKTPQKEFILVGAAHLIGTEGILNDLKRKGYKVEKISVKE